MHGLREQFETSFDALAAIGRDPDGGWTRLSWTPEDMDARQWFHNEADRLGLDTETDQNGNEWAYWRAGERMIVTGSHLDTVVNGGAFDGALGVVSGFLAVEVLQARGFAPDKTIAVGAFVEEEGAGFGAPTLGTRLMTGTYVPEAARELAGRSGLTFGDAMSRAGFDPTGLGPDEERVAAMDAMVELHVEQGRGLADQQQPVGRITGIWPHGRWRADVTGRADHAGAARIEDRSDPTLVLPTAVLSARRLAESLDARATTGRISIAPNTTNTVPAHVSVWLDARAADETTMESLVQGWTDHIADAATEAGMKASVERESFTPDLRFDDAIGAVIDQALLDRSIVSTAIPTAAGHDAGIISARVPTGMIHVRNPDGTSHAPNESAAVDDCVAGVEVLADVLERLATA